MKNLCTRFLIFNWLIWLCKYKKSSNLIFVIQRSSVSEWHRTRRSIRVRSAASRSWRARRTDVTWLTRRPTARRRQKIPHVGILRSSSTHAWFVIPWRTIITEIKINQRSKHEIKWYTMKYLYLPLGVLRPSLRGVLTVSLLWSLAQASAAFCQSTGSLLYEGVGLQK